MPPCPSTSLWMGSSWHLCPQKSSEPPSAHWAGILPIPRTPLDLRTPGALACTAWVFPLLPVCGSQSHPFVVGEFSNCSLSRRCHPFPVSWGCSFLHTSGAATWDHSACLGPLTSSKGWIHLPMIPILNPGTVLCTWCEYLCFHGSWLRLRKVKYLAQGHRGFEGAETGFELRKSSSELALRHPLPLSVEPGTLWTGMPPQSDHVIPGTFASPDSLLYLQHFQQCLTLCSPADVPSEGVCLSQGVSHSRAFIPCENFRCSPDWTRRRAAPVFSHRGGWGAEKFLPIQGRKSCASDWVIVPPERDPLPVFDKSKAGLGIMGDPKTQIYENSTPCGETLAQLGREKRHWRSLLRTKWEKESSCGCCKCLPWERPGDHLQDAARGTDPISAPSPRPVDRLGHIVWSWLVTHSGQSIKSEHSPDSSPGPTDSRGCQLIHSSGLYWGSQSCYWTKPGFSHLCSKASDAWHLLMVLKERGAFIVRSPGS